MRPAPEVRTAASHGMLVGAVGMLLFMTAHAILVKPLWTNAFAWARGVGVVLLGGGTVGIVYARVAPHLPADGVKGGVIYGGLFALHLAPFLVTGVLRIAERSPAIWVPVLVLGNLAVVLTAFALVGGRDMTPPQDVRLRAGLLILALFVLNAYPGFFLASLPELVPDKVPDPFPQSTALAAIYVASGALLGWLGRRDEGRRAPWRGSRRP